MTDQPEKAPWAGPISDESDIPWEAGKQVFRRWLELKGDRLLPARKQFTMQDLKPVLSSMYLVSVTYDPLDFTVTLCGSDVQAVLETNWAGRKISDLPNTGQTIERFTQQTKDLLPYGVRNMPATWSIYPDEFYSGMVLPMGEDGKTVDTIAGIVARIDHHLL